MTLRIAPPPLDLATCHGLAAERLTQADVERVLAQGVHHAKRYSTHSIIAVVDRAIALNPALEDFLGQDKDDATRLTDSFTRLEAILNQGMIPQ